MLAKCTHDNKTYVEKFKFECPDCDEVVEIMANGQLREICHVCGGRHWRSQP